MECGRPQSSGGHRSWRGQLGVWFACLALLIVTGVSTGAAANADDLTNGPNVALVDFNNANEVAAWTTVNDPVMGGRSTSAITFGDGGLTFSGTISLENNGGFASARGPENPDIGRKAAGATSLLIRAVGDGKTYVVRVGVGGQPWSYIQRFTTQAAVERTYTLPIAGFQAVGMRLDPAPNAPQALDPSAISRISVYILDKQQGPFEITINGIDAAG
jgi:hypothetical protein